MIIKTVKLGVWNLEKMERDELVGQKKEMGSVGWRPWRRAMSRGNGERSGHIADDLFMCSGPVHVAEEGGHLRVLRQMQILHPRSTIMCKGNGRGLRLVL